MTNSTVSIAKALRWGTMSLKKSHLSQPYRESSLLMKFVIGKDPLLADPKSSLSPKHLAKFQSLIRRRALREPFAYLTGQVKFSNQNISVNKHVLIPRPETELLVKLALSAIKNHPAFPKLNIVEIGTGSGAISIALAKTSPKIHLTATDISSSALAVAKKNIHDLNLMNQISLIKNDLLTSFATQSLDIIIANLPYIPTAYLKRLSPDIKNYEPLFALDGGPDGLDQITKLLQLAAAKLSPDGTIILEIWHTHPQPLKKLVKQYLPDFHLQIKQDLSHQDRFAIIRLK